jgi:hypothetical protein
MLYLYIFINFKNDIFCNKTMSSVKGNADIQLVPGPEASWVGQKSQGIVASRQHAIVYPKNGGTFTQGQKIRLEIPSQDYWDTSLFTISMRVDLTSGTGLAAALTSAVATQATLAPRFYGNELNMSYPENALQSHWLTTKNGIQCLFNRVRILQGSMVIADVQDYNKLNRMLKVNNLSREHQYSSDFINEGVYDPEDWEQKWMARNFYSSTVATAGTGGQFWNVRLNTGFLEIDKYFPVKYTGQITFELYLEDYQACLCSSVLGAFSDGEMPSMPVVLDPTTVVSYPNPTYTVSEVTAHCHFVVPIQEYDEEMLNTINEQGLVVMYSSWNQHTRQITSTGRQVISFQERAVSVRGGIAVMENNEDIGDVKDVDYHFASNNVKWFQWKLGNMYLPAQPVECENGSAFFELENFLGTVGNSQSGMLLDQRKFLTSQMNKTSARLAEAVTLSTSYSVVTGGTTGRTYENKKEMMNGNSMPTHFCYALNLEKSPGQLSGFNTSATNIDIELRFELDQQNKLANMPADPAGGTWIASQGTHIFQPSKYKCHDITASGGEGFYNGEQPDNPSFNGEGSGIFHTASEMNIPTEATSGAISTGAYTSGGTPSQRLTYARPLNRFPDSGRSIIGDILDPGLGVVAGGTTSTDFMYTKPASTSSLVTFWAYIDAQLNIMKVGQLEVVR